MPELLNVCAGKRVRTPGDTQKLKKRVSVVPATTKEGYIGIFVYLPTIMGAENFEAWFKPVLTIMLQGLAEDEQ